MVRVGIQADLPEELLQYLPQNGIELVRLPQHMTEPVEVEYWVLPFLRPEAEGQMPFLRGVKVMHSPMAGVDWVLPWKKEGITLCDGRGIHDVSTSEWVMTAILSSYKWIPTYTRAQERGDWINPKYRSPFLSEYAHTRGRYRVTSEELYGKTVLIIGYGSIGAATEKKLEAFGAKILRVARSARTSPVEVHAVSELEALIPQADVIVLLIPATAETKGLINRARMEKMKFGALLVNAARGPIVVTEDLIAMLETGKIRAALDVTDPEPLPEGHPIWHAPNCLITPHIAGPTPAVLERAYTAIGQNIERYLKGEPLENTVGDAGY